MRLTRFSDIGLRVLIYLVHEGERRSPVTVAEIASQFALPINHLVKVVGQLAKVGWITATRGRHGGLRLAANPATLTIGAVLRELEGEAELVDCVGTGCQLSADCLLRDALKEGMRAFYQAMDRFTLASISQGGTGEQVIRMHRTYLGLGGSIPA